MLRSVVHVRLGLGVMHFLTRVDMNSVQEFGGEGKIFDPFFVRGESYKMNHVVSETLDIYCSRTRLGESSAYRAAHIPSDHWREHERYKVLATHSL